MTKVMDWINGPGNKGRTAYLRAGVDGHQRGYAAALEDAALWHDKQKKDCETDANNTKSSELFDQYQLMEVVHLNSAAAIRAMKGKADG